MSKYTTELRYICESSIGNDKAGGYNKVADIIAQARPKIFDFSYPIFDESYRSVLETKIIKHYYTREIGLETFGLWKLKLDTKLNEIMPYYNQLYRSELLEFNPLYNFNITRDHNTKFDSKRTTGNDVSSSETINNTENSRNTTNTTKTTDNTHRDLYSDTPQGAMYNIELEENKYLTNARKVTDDNVDDLTSTDTTDSTDTASTTGSRQSSSRITSDGDDDFNSTEDYLEHVYGFEGKDASELLLKYRQTFLNIDMQVIEELEELFFQLW